MAYSFVMPAMVSLNIIGDTLGRLSDESRQGIKIDKDERNVIVQLANGSTVKYVKAIKHKFELTWDNIAESQSKTVDGYWGRNEINTLAQQQGAALTFTIDYGYSKVDTSRQQAFTVFVDSYDEQIFQRRPNGMNRWTLNLTLVEV